MLCGLEPFPQALAGKKKNCLEHYLLEPYYIKWMSKTVQCGQAIIRQTTMLAEKIDAK